MKKNNILTYQQFLNEKFLSDIYDESDEDRLSRSNNVVVSYKKIRHRTAQNRIKTIIFDAYDTKGSGTIWTVQIQIPDYRDISRSKKMSYDEKVRMVLGAGEVKVDCNCPDFLYGGFKYKATQFNYGIKIETIEPTIKNPELKGSACKHTIAVSNKILDYIDTIIDDIKNKK